MLKQNELLKLTETEEELLEYALVRRGFTSRQREVILLRVQHRFIKDVARALSVAQSTAEFHLSIIHKEIGVRSHRELIEYVQRLRDHIKGIDNGSQHAPSLPTHHSIHSTSHPNQGASNTTACERLQSIKSSATMIVLALMVALNTSQSRACDSVWDDCGDKDIWSDTFSSGINGLDISEDSGLSGGIIYTDDLFITDENGFTRDVWHQQDLERAREYLENNY